MRPRLQTENVCWRPRRLPCRRGTQGARRATCRGLPLRPRDDLARGAALELAVRLDVRLAVAHEQHLVLAAERAPPLLDDRVQLVDGHLAAAVHEEVARLAVARAHVHADRPLAVERAPLERLELSGSADWVTAAAARRRAGSELRRPLPAP